MKVSPETIARASKEAMDGMNSRLRPRALSEYKRGVAFGEKMAVEHRSDMRVIEGIAKQIMQNAKDMPNAAMQSLVGNVVVRAPEAEVGMRIETIARQKSGGGRLRSARDLPDVFWRGVAVFGHALAAQGDDKAGAAATMEARDALEWLWMWSRKRNEAEMKKCLDRLGLQLPVSGALSASLSSNADVATRVAVRDPSADTVSDAMMAHADALSEAEGTGDAKAAARHRKMYEHHRREFEALSKKVAAKVNPSEYLKEHGKCPPGWHQEDGKCVETDGEDAKRSATHSKSHRPDPKKPSKVDEDLENETKSLLKKLGKAGIKRALDRDAAVSKKDPDTPDDMRNLEQSVDLDDDVRDRLKKLSPKERQAAYKRAMAKASVANAITAAAGALYKSTAREGLASTLKRGRISVVKALLRAASALKADAQHLGLAPPQSAMSQPKLRQVFGRMKKILEVGYGGTVEAKVKTIASRTSSEYRCEFTLPKGSGHGAFRSVTVVLRHDSVNQKWTVTSFMMIGGDRPEQQKSESLFHKANMSQSEFEKLVVMRPGKVFVDLTWMTNDALTENEARW